MFPLKNRHQRTDNPEIRFLAIAQSFDGVTLMKISWITLSFLVTAWLGAALPARAEEKGLRAELARVAAQVKDLLKGGTSVAVQDFNDRSTRRANSGPGLQEAFQAELRKLGLTINDNDNHIVTAEYTYKDDPVTQLLVVSL